VSVNYSVRQMGEVTVLDLSGRISLGEALAFGAGNALALHDLVRDFVTKGSEKILLNLRHVTYVDSSGLGELVSCATTVQNRGGQMRVCNATERVGDLLRITHLNSVLRLYLDEASALQAFSARAATSAA
jgi:anti-sigma B factor antagonist